MALWQYSGELVPEHWLIKKYGQLPCVLENYLMTEDTNLDEIEEPHWWRDVEIPSNLVEQISNIMPPSNSWSDEALMFGEKRTNDFEIWYDKGEVDAIYFRLDLRDTDLEVLSQITQRFSLI